MNQYEPVISVYVRGCTFLEEKPIDQECINKFWIKVNEAASMPNPPFSQKLIDESKKKCQNMLNPNVPEFQPKNNKALMSTQAKIDKLYQQVVEGARQQNLLITKYIESQNVQEAEDVYQNHSENYNCQTDMQNGFASSDQENFTPSEPTQWLEGQKIPEGCYNPYQSNFEDYDSGMNTGYSSSDEENWTPTDSAQWLEGQKNPGGCYYPYHSNSEDYDSGMNTGYSSSDEENWTPTDSAQWLGQEVAQVTEGLYNPYQNQVDNVWFDNYYLSTQ